MKESLRLMLDAPEGTCRTLVYNAVSPFRVREGYRTTEEASSSSMRCGTSAGTRRARSRPTLDPQPSGRRCCQHRKSTEQGRVSVENAMRESEPQQPAS